MLQPDRSCYLTREYGGELRRLVGDAKFVGLQWRREYSLSRDEFRIAGQRGPRCSIRLRIRWNSSPAFPGKCWRFRLTGVKSSFPTRRLLTDQTGCLFLTQPATPVQHFKSRERQRQLFPRTA